MKITNKGLYNLISQSNMLTNDLVDYLHIISKLIKKHGPQVFSINFLKQIESVDQQLASLLKILNIYKKNKANDIKSLIKTLKESDGYIPNFEVNMIENSQKYDIHKKLKHKFKKSNIKTNKNIDLGIFINGEGRYYKRNIDQDLEKILG